MQVLTLRVACTQVVADMVESCRANGFTDIIVVHEHRGEPDGLVVCHLPFGALHIPRAGNHSHVSEDASPVCARADGVLRAYELCGKARHQGGGFGNGVRSLPASHLRGALGDCLACTTTIL